MSNDWETVNKRAIEILIKISERDIKSLNKLEVIPARLIIEVLKNNIEDLEFFFNWFKKWAAYFPDSGSYHFRKVRKKETIDIYHKYGFGPMNFCKEDVTQEIWDHAYKIGYIREKDYEQGCA